MKVRKLIDLDTDVIRVLQKMAKDDQRKLKPFMEKILIDASKSNKNEERIVESHKHG